jgi:hypothetical protein
MTGQNAFSMTFDPLKKYLYVACQGGGIYGYYYNAGTGALTPLAGSPFPSGNAPVWISVAGR